MSHFRRMHPQPRIKFEDLTKDLLDDVDFPHPPTDMKNVRYWVDKDGTWYWRSDEIYTSKG